MSIPYGGVQQLHYMGGPGGTPLNAFHPIESLNFNCGDVIDGFSLNNSKTIGGPGGVKQAALQLNDDLYICDIEYGMRDYRGHLVLSGLRFHLSDKSTYPQNGQFGAGALTNSMVGDICSVNPEAKGKNFRVISLSAHAGDFLDALIANVVVGFVDAPKVSPEPVRAIYNVIVQGGEVIDYTDATDQTTHSFIRSYSQTHDVSVNASVQAKYALMASINCSYENSVTNASQFTNELEMTLERAETISYTLPANNDDDVQAILRTVKGDIYNISQDGGKKYVFIPHPHQDVLPISLRSGNIDSAVGLYDLGDYMKEIDTDDWVYESPEKNGGMNVVKVPKQ